MHQESLICEKQTHPEHPVGKCQTRHPRLHRRDNSAIQLQDRVDLCADCGTVFAEGAHSGERCECHHQTEGGGDQTGGGDQGCTEVGHHRHSAAITAQRQDPGLRGGFRIGDVLQGNLRQDQHLFQQPHQQDLLGVVALADQTGQTHHHHPEVERGGEGAGEGESGAKNQRGEARTGEDCCDGTLFQDGRPESGGADIGVVEEEPDRGDQERDEMPGLGGGGAEESQIGCAESAIAEQGNRNGIHSH